MITLSAPAIFNFFTDESCDARLITFIPGLSCLAVSTTNKLSASTGKVIISALAFLIPASSNTSSLVASPFIKYGTSKSRSVSSSFFSSSTTKGILLLCKIWALSLPLRPKPQIITCCFSCSILFSILICLYSLINSPSEKNRVSNVIK